MSRFWNENTRRLVPYTAGEQPQNMEFIKLNTNENPYPPSPLVIKRIKEYNPELLRLYPNSEGAFIKKAVSEFYNIPQESVFAGNGSDEILALLFKTFFDSGTKIGFPDVTYSFYPVYCALYEIPYIQVPVKDDFSIDFADYPEDLKGIVFANPNAPTGLYLEPAVIEELVKSRPNTLIVVDEAYIDFGGQSCVPLTQRYDNLLIVQTLSKSRALAGQRIGLAIGCRELLDGLVKVKDSFNSYPLDAIAQIAGQAAFEDREYFDITRKKIINTRERIKQRLIEMGAEVTDTKTNFLFVRIPGTPGPEAQKKLRDNGVLVRNFNGGRISDWLRITVGTDEDMDRVADIIKRIMEESAAV